MTTAVRSCLTPGCHRAPRPEWAYCQDCADRLITAALRAPVIREPEWVRRMRAGRGVSKDWTAAPPTAF